MRRIIFSLAACAALGFISAVAVAWPWRFCPGEPAVVEYDPAMPHLQCLAGRVVAESKPGLSAAERAALWRQYGLSVSYEWVVPQDGFSYHELEVMPYSLGERVWALLTHASLPPRELPALIAQLNDDARLNWACPDALILEWADGGNDSAAGDLASDAAGTYGVSLIDERYRVFSGSLDEWAAKADSLPEPLPDFEYYRECAPDGTVVPWAPELAASAPFQQQYLKAYGTGQAQALTDYRAAGSPLLAPVTICVADTGMLLNHPDFAGRLHPNSVDTNYRNYVIAPPSARPASDEQLTDRNNERAVGLPRLAIRGQPAGHGTCSAGVAARCTAGFNASNGEVRLLPVSVKSDRTFVITGWRIKSPISAAVKLAACLYQNYPTGEFIPDPADPVQNSGDVRVVTVSASVPKAMFTEAEWKVVANIVGKAAGSIMEDLRVNDRVYVFAAGNEAQGEPNKPGDVAVVLSASASMAFDGARAWAIPVVNEGSNLGPQCVSAPGHGIITSAIYPCPNLAYLPEDEMWPSRPRASIPARPGSWLEQTNRFNATSAATPQISALAALLYAQDPTRKYQDVIKLIGDSTAGRKVSAPYGEARGLVDYAAALGW